MLSDNEWIDVKVVRWLWSIRPEDRIPVEKLKISLKIEEFEGVFTRCKTAMVWSSKKNGSEYLV